MARENQPGEIVITPYNIDEAKPGYVVVKNEKGRLVLADPSFITKEIEGKVNDALAAVGRFDAFTRHVKHFKTLCKSHFVNAFLLWKTKAMEGEIEVADDSLLYADQAVLNGDKKVSEALNENLALKDIFIKIYGEYENDEESGDETVSFPEV